MISAKYIENGYELILCYEEQIEGGEICEGQENDSWPSRKDSYHYVLLYSLHRPRSKHLSYDRKIIYSKFNPAKLKHVSLVVVRYGDGDTFGTSHGNCYIEGVYKTSDEADKVVDSIIKNEYKGYKAWDQYFGGLEDCYVVSMKVED